MKQNFVTYAIDGTAKARVLAELHRRDYSAADTRLNIIGITVRVREGTEDEAEVDRIVRTHAPEANRLPHGGTPSATIPGYREGRP